MGFRMRRSVKLLPGVRFNVSSGGASLSVGPRGASMTLSPHGARASFGLPGTGMSYSTPMFRPQSGSRRRAPTGGKPITSTAELMEAVQDPRSTVVYRKSGRRLSASQLGAVHRELARRESHAAAQVEVDRFEEDLKQIVESWREEIAVPTPEEVQRATLVRPFVEPEPPAAPNYSVAEQTVRQRVTLEIVESHPRSFQSRLAWLLVFSGGASVLAALVLVLPLADWGLPSVIAWTGVLLVASFAALIAGHSAEGRYRRESEERAEAAHATAWPPERDRLRNEHADAVEAFRREVEVVRARWDSSEAERVAWVMRLVNGDIAAVEEAVTESLGDLDFPFESDCSVGIEDERVAFVNLDLPEIEDVIPETKHKVLKSGEIRDTKRKADERNSDYARLVCGLALAVAATAFAAAPTIQTVTVAAFTQRKRRGSNDAEDAYVYETRITRDTLMSLNTATIDSIAALSQCQTRLEWGTAFALKKIAAPSWASELPTASADANIA